MTIVCMWLLAIQDARQSSLCKYLNTFLPVKSFPCPRLMLLRVCVCFSLLFLFDSDSMRVWSCWCFQPFLLVRQAWPTDF